MALNLEPKQIETLTKLGENYFTLRQCATVLEVDFTDFKREISNPHSEAYRAYFKGFYESEIALRESIMELALRGSSPAQAQLIRILDDTSKVNDSVLG